MTKSATTDRDPAASMSLITELMQNPLDPAYQQETDRRAAVGRSPGRFSRSPLLILTVVLLGFALVSAAAVLRVPSGVQQKQRDALITRIDSRQSDIAGSSTQIAALRTRIAALQAGALARNNGATTANELRTLSAATGLAPVRGPGVVLEVNDAVGSDAGSGADPRAGSQDGSTDGQGRLNASDLQIVVDGLWQGGAEAIAINGQRLTAQSAIRSAGQAILINFTPLQPPYAVSAIGPPTLQKDFERSESGIYLRGLTNSVGIRQNLRVVEELKLPAAAPAGLRFAKETP